MTFGIVRFGGQGCECGKEIFRDDPFLASGTMSPVFRPLLFSLFWIVALRLSESSFSIDDEFPPFP
jgi:hypothetical protein